MVAGMEESSPIVTRPGLAAELARHFAPDLEKFATPQPCAMPGERDFP
jgi:hypothetical protein